MTDDLLTQMTRALADEHDGATAVPEATRARIIRGLAETRPRRSRWVLLGVPAIAVFAGGTAFAAATGNLPRIVEQAFSVFTGEAELEEAPAEVARTGLGKKGAAPLSVPASDAAEPALEAPEEEPAELPLPEATPEQAASDKSEETARLAPKPRESMPEKAAPPPPPDPTLLTYRAAHEAHFKNGDCPGAVRGYQKYLSEAPSGTFVLEAKYNLGVCLARLGRTEEARRALEPFSQGKYGNYRQVESQKILDAL